MLRRWIIGGFLILAVLALPKLLVPLYAAYKRNVLVSEIMAAKTEQEMVERYARYMATNWQRSYRPTSGWRILRQWLPKPLKPDKDATIFLGMHGECSDLVKASAWVLDGLFAQDEHHIITPHAAHSAISLELLGNRIAFIDPYAGVMFRDSTDLLSLPSLIAKLREGKDFADYAIPLRPNPDLRLYKEITLASHAREPRYLDVTIDFPLEGKDRLSIGSIDGDTSDIAKEAARKGLTTHLFYIGPRYEQKFRFKWRLPKDGRTYTIRMHLTDHPIQARLPEFSVSPSISNRTLLFTMPPGIHSLLIDSTHTERGNWYGLDAVEIEAGAPHVNAQR